PTSGRVIRLQLRRARAYPDSHDGRRTMSGVRYDLIVIGCGIHGAGVAQAAAAAGHSVLLLEKTAPAAGTSSRSSKLIHGGLRYLETGQFGLVREGLRERELLLRIAPRLVRRLPILIPVYNDSRHSPAQVRAGLTLYALFAGLAPAVRFREVKDRGPELLGGLRQDGLRAVFRYQDAQTDDAALTRAVLASALRLGAVLLNPAMLERATREAAGYRVVYRYQGREHSGHCTVLVNAAGPWVNAVQARIDPAPPQLDITLVQGTHVHYSEPLSEDAFYVESPADRRPVFLLPWRSGTLVGTTETLFSGDPDGVRVLPDEQAYLDDTLRHYFPNYRGHGLSSMAGLRVLPQSGGPLLMRRRETVLSPDDPRRPHLVAVYGGKLTAYRSTAARLMRLVRAGLPERSSKAHTSELVLEPD
ncbi:MAG: glycerol-3-phosphate dehydrogenase/oxidase, partial [Gammaproteobacteria bacterium]